MAAGVGGGAAAAVVETVELRPCGAWHCLLEEAAAGAEGRADSAECELCGDWVRELGLLGCWRCTHKACLLCWLRGAWAKIGFWGYMREPPSCPCCRAEVPKERLAQLGAIHDRHRDQLVFPLPILRQSLRTSGHAWAPLHPRPSVDQLRERTPRPTMGFMVTQDWAALRPAEPVMAVAEPLSEYALTRPEARRARDATQGSRYLLGYLNNEITFFNQPPQDATSDSAGERFPSLRLSASTASLISLHGQARLSSYVLDTARIDSSLSDVSSPEPNSEPAPMRQETEPRRSPHDLPVAWRSQLLLGPYELPATLSQTLFLH